jgi:hypothetical protein
VLEKQHVEVNEIERTAKTLDQRDRSGMCRGYCGAGFAGQVRGKKSPNS